MNKVIALIPAKKNSKRLSNKNLRKFKGKSLISLAIESTLKSNLISKLYVSSDSNKILDITKKLGADPIKRNKRLCQNSTTADEVIYDFIKKKLNHYNKDTVLIYLQPTSPLRNHIHLNKALNVFFRNKKKPLVSVNELTNKDFAKSYYIENNLLNALNKKFTNKNDQQIPKIYSQNGAIYIFSFKSFLKNRSIPQINLLPFVMNKTDSLDINYKKDLNFK
jgi:CMP-N,N'-diacetyllegionaminic acid synthase